MARKTSKVNNPLNTGLTQKFFQEREIGKTEKLSHLSSLDFALTIDLLQKYEKDQSLATAKVLIAASRSAKQAVRDQVRYHNEE